MKKSYFNIDTNASIFNELEHTHGWWDTLKNDPDLYINVRKDNRINVYYRGASIMNLSHSRNAFKALIHNYYLGVDKGTSAIYGDIELSPEDIVSKLSLIKERVLLNTKYKGKIETNGNYAESSSEKFIQSEIYKQGNYIDTEFALELEDENKTDIRIDLVKINDKGQIQFVELKRVSDDRLTPKDGEDAEIITQMQSYTRFLKEAQELSDKEGYDVITKYYTDILCIMTKIGILPQHLPTTKITEVNNNVELLITRYNKRDRYDRRLQRLETIEKICSNVKSNIADVIAAYKNLD